MMNETLENIPKEFMNMPGLYDDKYVVPFDHPFESE